MTLTNGNIIQARRVIQNNQEFLIGTFQIRQVRNFTKYTEHLIVGFEEVIEEEKVFADQDQIRPLYNPEIQRKTNGSKVERIADFLLYDPSAMFPTNIVIAIPNQVIDSLDEVNGIVNIELNAIVKKELDKKEGAVFLTIIDGQHRIKGIERAIERISNEITDLNKVLSTSPDNVELKERFKKNGLLLERLLSFELLVTFFIDPTLEYQAMIFATINKTQTKVPENLVYSLFGLTKDDSPQKTALEVVLALNGIEKSAFYNRIKLVGGNYKRGEKVPLSQATMVKSILNYISNNPREAEIDRFKKRTELKNNPKRPFRPYYANNDDRMIVRIMYSFFNAVRSTFTNENGDSYWDIKEEEGISNVLQTNVGYQAMLKVLADLLVTIPDDKKDDRGTYESYLSKAKDIDWEDSTGQEKRYPFTSSTITTLYQDVRDKIF